MNCLKKRFGLYLSIVAIISIILRCLFLFQKELCYWDEGIFLMGVKFLYWRIDVVFSQIMNHFGCSFPVFNPDQYTGYPVFLQKPFHVILLMITTLFTGLTKWSASFHSAIYGSISVILTGWIGRRLFNAQVGLLAALWLALQPYHLHYSRLGLHETDSMVMFLAGICLYLLWQSKQKVFYIFGSGLFFMLAVGTSYRLIIFSIIMSGMIFFFEIRRTTFKQTIRPALWFISGCCIAVIFLEAAYFFTFHPHYLWSQPSSYIALLRKKFISSESTFNFKHITFYLRMFRLFDGWFPTVLTGISALWLLFKRDLHHKWIAILYVVPFIFFSLTSTRLARTPTGLLPWGALSVAVFICDGDFFSTKLSGLSRKIIPVGLILAGLFSFTVHMPPIYRIQSGYKKVFEFLDKQDAELCLSTMKPIYAYYKGRSFVTDPGKTDRELCQQIKNSNVRYICLDWQKHLRYQPSYQTIEANFKPVFIVENPVVDFFATLHENHLPADVPVLFQIDPGIRYIKVYDLWEIAASLGCTHQGSLNSTSMILKSEE